MVMKKFLLLFLLPLSSLAQPFTSTEVTRWKQQAKQVTIIRDNWGIPHVYGKTDADAVFGLMYAQCEDDFQRIEMNYIEKILQLRCNLHRIYCLLKRSWQGFHAP